MRDIIGAIFPRKKDQNLQWEQVVEEVRASAAFLAQGASYSYLRARTLLAGPRLFQDEDFGFALQICKWEGFAVAAQDIILMLESELRSALPHSADARARGLAKLYADILASEALPDHRLATGWSDSRKAFDTRLAVYMNAEPLKPDAISIATALKILETAPIEDSVREADQMMVVNNVAFRFIDCQSRLRKEFDFGKLAEVLGAEMREEK